MGYDMISILAEGLLSGVVGFVLDASAKAAVLLLVATIATIVARRSSAAVRHRMWCLTFSSLVLLPVFCAALPRWNVAILPAAESRRAVVETATAAANLRTANSPAHTALTEAKAVVSTRAAAEPQRPDAPAPQTGAVAWTALLTIWIAGALLVLARQGIEIVAVRRLVSSCRPIPNVGWTELLAESQAKLRLRRSVSLVQTEAAIIPMTCGVLRPVVLLPSFSVDWSPERRRCVLLHELAHVQRLDVLLQMVATVACSLYWFNPLIWYAARRLRIERELACDECVVAAGERASDYAEQLVEIARSCRTLRLSAGVAMARSSKLEERIVALLDRARSHHPITRRLSFGLALAATLLATVAAVLQPVARAAVVAESGEQPAQATVENSAPAPSTPTQSTPAKESPKKDPADAQQNAAKSPRKKAKKNGGSDLLKQIREASEPILAEMAEKHGYRLAPGQSLHRVPPPFDPIRMTYYRVGNPSQSQAIPAGPSAMSFRWEGNALHRWGMTFGGSPHDGYSLSGVADAIQGLKSQQIVGPPELLNAPIPGDWVSRPGMADEAFAQELQTILQNELKLPIRLQFRTHRREVYVAKGLYRFVPLPGQRGEIQLYLENKTETMHEVQIFGKQLAPNSGAGGGSGNFDEFLLWLGRWIDMPIVNDVQKPPRQISWVQHGDLGKSSLTNQEQHDATLVLHNIETQTGVHFISELRTVKSLFVERGQ
jgi:beta-lactamase regulating signal transducer with metallopeptidase domain